MFLVIDHARFPPTRTVLKRIKSFQLEMNVPVTELVTLFLTHLHLLCIGGARFANENKDTVHTHRCRNKRIIRTFNADGDGRVDAVDYNERNSGMRGGGAFK